MEKTDHRLALIHTAANLFQKQGYSATGVNQIIRESKTPRGSFYYYFPNGKEQLANEAIRFTGEAVAKLLDLAFCEAPTFSQGVESITKNIADQFVASHYTMGCPIASIHLEKTPKSKIISQASMHVFSLWVDVIEKHARRLGCADQSATLAQAIILSIEGAWILARAEQNPRAFAVCADMVKALVPYPD